MVGVQEVIDYVILHRKACLENNGGHIRPLHNTDRIFFIFSTCQLLSFPLTPTLSVRLSLAIAPIKENHLGVSSSSRTIKTSSILSRKAS
jgi:hypothetical protein